MKRRQPSPEKTRRQTPARDLGPAASLAYYPLYALVWTLSLLPFPVIYLLSDFTAWLLHSVAGYRRKVVRQNLRKSFPEKSGKELAAVERKFYSFLADYAFETIKMATMSRRTMLRRMTVSNAEAIDRAAARGRNSALFLGHFCNWEWVSSLPMHFAPGPVGCQVYHRLHNRAADRLFMVLRTRFDAWNLERDEVFRQLLRWKREGKVSVTGFIADQTPGMEVHLFTEFLNHDTPVFTGPERIARFLDAECWYCRLTRPRRGHYNLEFVEITREPAEEPVFGITRRYMELLEADIRKHPQYWLWSHRRWKRTRAMFEQHWGDKAAEMLSHL